jgi:DNA replication protein DnaC
MSNIVFAEKAYDYLEKLGLETAQAHLDQTSQTAAAESWSYTEFLGRLLDGELTARLGNNIRIAYKMANFPYLKKLENFNFDAQPSIDKKLVDELATLRFVFEGRSLILLGPPGTGKTHLAIALATLIVEQGRRAYFTTAADMVRKLNKAMDENRLHRAMQMLVHPSLLIIDELGYLQLDKAEASLLFQVICKRYDKNQPIIITSNKAFSQWGDIFANDPVMASAALDRLLHKSTVINIKGESYRLKEKKKAGIPLEGGDIVS